MKFKELAYTGTIPNGKGSFTAKVGIYPDEDVRVAREKLKAFVLESIEALK